MVLGTMLIGAYLAMNDPSGYMVGGLFAFMMLSQRVAQPLVGLARLVEDYEEVGAAIGEAGSVLNRPLETDARLRRAAAAAGRRHHLRRCHLHLYRHQDAGARPGQLLDPRRHHAGHRRAQRLGQVDHHPPAPGHQPRLLSGFLKLDGSDLREINLRHLRQSFGVVLQDNFLFRGSIRDNIIAGRPGLTLADAVHAARLAGAEEFIERMPNGYETYIEEGSPNLSGGQTPAASRSPAP